MDLASAFLNLNWLAIIVSAFSAFMVGGIWYGPLFGRAWMTENNLTEEDLAKRNQKIIFGWSLVLNLIMAFNLAMFLGKDADMFFGAAAGLFTGAFFIAAMLGVFYLFESQSLKLFTINGGYATVAMTVMGTVLTAFN